jgi:hypothetical protein
MAEAESPREIILEARNDGQNLELLQRVFQSSRIKAETVSRDPIRIKIPATTRAVSVLLLLLDELKPAGNIILDNGSSYSIDEEGLSKLRRIAIKSLSNEVPEKDVASSKSRPASALRSNSSEEMKIDVQSNPGLIANDLAHGFKSSEISLLTMVFSLLIGIVATFVTLLAFLGKIGELYSVVILGTCVIGAFSLMHRYVSAFKESSKS